MIEITHSTSRYTFRLSAENPSVIERKLNRHGARFTSWRMFESQTEAKLAMIRMRSAEGDAATADGLRPAQGDGPEEAANV